MERAHGYPGKALPWKQIGSLTWGCAGGILPAAFTPKGTLR